MPGQPKLNILVVDSRPTNGLALASALASLGERVVVAEDGESALRHLLREEFALILLDALMPGMDGFETARMIKAWPKTRNVPLIFTSATAKTGTFEARGYALGAVDYLPTPFEPAHLQAKAAVFLELARQTEQLREQTEKLVQSIRFKDEFLSIVSHELKTPISVIMGFAEILEDELGGKLSKEQKDYVAQISSSADRLLAFVNDLLDMGRIQAGRFAIYPKRTVFADVVEEAVKYMIVLARRKRQKLSARVDEALPELMVDTGRVRQVLLNLLSNAIKFTPEHGQIEVRVRKDGSVARCEVQDSGPGISATQQADIFKQFSQVDTTSTRAAGGTGLGLSISKAIVESHGGSIGVESAPGKGSLFWFTLPLPSKIKRRKQNPTAIRAPET
jgi:signal transduction histidine kinase